MCLRCASNSTPPSTMPAASRPCFIDPTSSAISSARGNERMNGMATRRIPAATRAAMGRRRGGRPINGWVILDKPLGLSSSQAVGAVRRITGAAKAGHGGTLDPLATGVLPIALGEATKTVAWAMAGRKVYRFRLRWGEARDTDDTEGKVTATSAVRPSRAAIEAALPGFVGTLPQRPPAYSALKVAGERAYDLAREGAAVTLAPRLIDIHALRLLAVGDDDHAE